MFELGPTDGALSTLLGRQRGVRMKLYLLFSPLFLFFSDVSHVSQEFSCNLCEAAAPVRGDSHVSEMKPSSDVSNLFKSLKTDPPSSNAASPGTEDCDSFARSSAGSHFFFFFSTLPLIRQIRSRLSCASRRGSARAIRCLCERRRTRGHQMSTECFHLPGAWPLIPLSLSD